VRLSTGTDRSEAAARLEGRNASILRNLFNYRYERMKCVSSTSTAASAHLTVLDMKQDRLKLNVNT
jgi:hypothetical protein